MKGLIIRDFYCLKKELLTFLAVTISVCILSVMFVLSMQYGNLADAIANIQQTEMLEAETLVSMVDMVILLAIFLPIALVSSVTECFKADRQAGFPKVLFSMPLSCKKIVGSRYLTCFLFSGVCMFASIICGALLSSVSKTMEFTKLLSTAMSLCAFALIYMSLVMLLLYLFGTEKADYIQAIPLLVMMVIGIICMAEKIEQMSETELYRETTQMMDAFRSFLEEKYLLFFAVAVFCMFLSCLLSIKIVERKREAI